MYHYTGVDGFISIIESRKLWITSTATMNDHKETKWFKEKLSEYLKDNYKKEEVDTIKLLWFRLLESFFDVHLCSFSNNGDKLSQWRAYSDDGTGVSIKFKRDELNLSRSVFYGGGKVIINDDLLLENVIYDKDIQKEKILSLINQMLFLSEHPNQEILEDVFSKALIYSCTFKNEAFSEESEIRIIDLAKYNSDKKVWEIIKPLVGNAIGNKSRNTVKDLPKFRNSGGHISSYFELELSGGEIEEIVIGPKSNLTEMSIRMFLQTNDIYGVKIRDSEASYR